MKMQRGKNSYRKEELEAALSMIKNWRRKCFEHSGNSNDPLLPLFTKGFDTMVVIASPSSDSSTILRSLDLLENERKIALQYESEDFDILRHFSFGFIEAFNLLMNIESVRNHEEQTPMANDTNAQNSNLPPSSDFTNEQIDYFDDDYKVNIDPLDYCDLDKEMSNAIPSLPAEPRDEPVGSLEVVSSNNQITLDASSNGELSEVTKVAENVPHVPMTDDLVEIDENLNDHSTNTSKMPLNANPNANSPVEKISENMPRVSMGDGLVYNEENMDDPASDAPKDSSDNSEIGRKGHSGRVSKSSRKVDSTLSSEKCSKFRLSNTHLECPECEFSSRSVNCWIRHLKEKHRTTPILDCIKIRARVALLCECGKESFSNNHLRECPSNNYTVIPKRDGPIRRIGDGNENEGGIGGRNKTDLECLACEYRTRSVTGFVSHIQHRHFMTPTQAGLAFRCDCGTESQSHHHVRKCDIANVIIVRKGEGAIRRIGDGRDNEGGIGETSDHATKESTIIDKNSNDVPVVMKKPVFIRQKSTLPKEKKKSEDSKKRGVYYLEESDDDTQVIPVKKSVVHSVTAMVTASKEPLDITQVHKGTIEGSVGAATGTLKAWMPVSKKASR